MRTLLIAGNWKLNPTTAENAVALAEGVKTGLGAETDVHVAVCPPFIFLDRIDRVLAGSPIGLGSQDLFWENSGAFTGEVSGPMLVDIGCTHVIIGHSERRHGMGESNADVNKKVKAALATELIPIVCVGETKEERLAEQTEAVLLEQLSGSLADLSPEQAGKLVLAYEPVWAIGTGLTATPEQAQAAHAFIREWLGKTFGEATAARVTVQYGGSVKPDNAEELLARPDIDGALVGGASLKASDFLAIIQAGQAVTARGKP
jgi:triosephosphate isomerase